MLERILILLGGGIFFYLLRFKIMKKPFSPKLSAVIGILILLSSVHMHYAFLPHETFQGGVTYISLGMLAFLILQYGFQKTESSEKTCSEKK